MADNVHAQCLAWSTHPHFDCGVESGYIKMHTFQLWKIESWPHGTVCEIQGKRNQRKDCIVMLVYGCKLTEMTHAIAYRAKQEDPQR